MMRPFTEDNGIPSLVKTISESSSKKLLFCLTNQSFDNYMYAMGSGIGTLVQEHAFELPKPTTEGATGVILDQVFNAVPNGTTFVLVYINIHGVNASDDPTYFYIESPNAKIKVMPSELTSSFQILRRKGITTALVLNSCSGALFEEVVHCPDMSIAPDASVRALGQRECITSVAEFFKNLDSDDPRTDLDGKFKDLFEKNSKMTNRIDDTWGATNGAIWKFFTYDKETVFFAMWHEVITHFNNNHKSQFRADDYAGTEKKVHQFLMRFEYDYHYCSENFVNASDFIAFIDNLNRFNRIMCSCVQKLCYRSIVTSSEEEVVRIINQVYLNDKKKSMPDVFRKITTTDELLSEVLQADAGTHFRANHPDQPSAPVPTAHAVASSNSSSSATDLQSPPPDAAPQTAVNATITKTDLQAILRGGPNSF